jgi:parvulin-like peptidyl-prolyl isomerase
MKKKNHQLANKLSCVLALAAVFALGAKTSERAQPNKTTADDSTRAALTVADINGDQLTLGYVEAAAKRARPAERRELTQKQKRVEFAEMLIKEELMAAEATRRGFNKHSEVESVAKNQLAQLMLRRIADTVEAIKPTDEELQAYYDANYASYHKSEKARIRHILISAKDKAEKLLAQALEKPMNQYEFKRLAQDNSEDEVTRAAGGAVPFFARTSEREDGDPAMDEAVVNAAFKLRRNGEIYPRLVKSSKGYHLVMRTGHRAKMDLSFERARNRLVTLVRREKRKEDIAGAIAALKTRFQVELFEENLKYVVIELSSGRQDTDKGAGMRKKGTPRKSNTPRGRP